MNNTLSALPRVPPKTVGIAPSGLLAFVDALDRAGGAHSVMLLRHGKVALEAWWQPYGPNDPHMLYSLSKSFASTAVGLAVAEGRLTVDDKVVSFFPDKVPATIDPNLAQMRVWDLLTMSTGHDKDATGPMRADVDGDWTRGFFALPVEHTPGTKFVYNSAATYLLSAIVQTLTGETLLSYLTPRLFVPLGIENATWESAPNGVNVGGWGLGIRTEDIAKFGQLYLQQGQWNGRQIVPAQWIQDATAAQVSNGDPEADNDWSQGYGYQFWRCRHNAYRGDGAFGQFCVVLPDFDAVLAITSGTGDMGAVLNAAWEHLLPAMEQATPGGEEALRGKIASLAIATPTGQATSPLAARVSGKTFRFADNPQAIESLTVTFDADSAQITLRDAKGEQTVVCGSGDWVRGTARLDVTPSDKVAARGVWTDDRTYTATWCFYETPYFLTVACAFAEDPDQVTLTLKRNVGFGPVEQLPLIGRAE